MSGLLCAARAILLWTVLFGLSFGLFRGGPLFCGSSCAIFSMVSICVLESLLWFFTLGTCVFEYVHLWEVSGIFFGFWGSIPDRSSPVFLLTSGSGGVMSGGVFSSGVRVVLE